MNYLKAVMQKDEQLKISELQNIISIGEKLKKNVTPDKKKLEILIGRENKSKTVTTSTQNKNVLFSINSVYTSNNNIIIDFNVDIDENFIKSFDLIEKTLYRKVFDINGYFKDAIPTKLELNGINKITLGQFKPDVLRIVLSNDKNIVSSYKINKRQIIISLDNLEKNQNTNINKQNEIVVEKKNEEKNITNEINIDTQNPIRSISSSENKIVVKFNKNYEKKNIKQFSQKNGANFEYTFDIDGKYKYTAPTKLQLNNIDRVIVIDNNDKVRIKIINKNNPKITYSLSSRELVINIIATANTNNKKETKVTPVVTAPVVKTPPKKNKVIVIDAGHGGSDAGAVGPNKRYEKVVNLNVTKYLASILKQRGYTVYLTRSNDKFIKVMDRTILANEKNADLFMSIHTNAVPKEKANEVDGIETFFLSPARSERAKRVAALENKSDIREMSNSSKDVFLESLNRPRITASHKFAIDVQAGLLQSARTKYKDVKDSGVREGPFWVLVGAQMPSILIELGYISHPTESKRLYDKDYQQLLANGIANGVDSYFSKNP